VIDELDTFNAQVTLALARLARFPESAELAETAEWGLAPQDRKTEEMAARWVFGGQLSAANWLGVYLKFWRIFPWETSKVHLRRLTLNAPPLALRGAGSISAVNFDERLGATRGAPEAWVTALNPFDDFLLFSDYGWTASEQAKVLNLIQTGATITLLRPSLRCHWFDRCNVRHVFTDFLEQVEARFNLQPLHRAESPILATVLGVGDRK
jgi:hypothetical protein